MHGRRPRIPIVHTLDCTHEVPAPGVDNVLELGLVIVCSNCGNDFDHVCGEGGGR